ncbi:MAG: YifB family Mg chelatase-like AAA ATPase, partial [Candidatus Faecousia sp.]|nr:YifB family Mg chelatase-like AAA ATPase [Candidatus Faecousia sp.]
EPFAVKQLSAQSEEGNWREEKPVFAEIAEPLRGEHSIRFMVEDMTSPARKKSEALIRGIRFYRETLPTVYVHIDESIGSVEAMNADPDHHTRCYGSIEIRVPEGYVCEYAGEGSESYEGGWYTLEYIRGRGESTWSEAKKPYKIKLESKADLFGMGANKHWALIANFFDRSFVRNRLTYRLGEALGLDYTPRLVPVEVVINGDYQGLYYLSETVRVGDSRVAIDDLESYTAAEGDISGGYLLSNRRPWDTEGYLFETDRSGTMTVVSPEALDDPLVGEETLREMFEYIVGYFQDAENAVFGLNGLDANGVHYTEYLDLDALARVYLIQEFSMNRDAYRTDSSFLYKPRGGKLYWGPLWDFDLDAWGGDSVETYLADDGQAAQVTEGIYHQYAWFRVLRGDPVFVEAVRAAWGGPDCDDPATLRFQLAEAIQDGGLLDRYEEELTCAAEANADLPGYTFDYLAEADWLEGPTIETDFHGEIYRLKRWIGDRMRWFDENIENLLDENARVDLTFISDGETLEIRNVVNDEPVFGFPVPEAREGRLFAGWYADAVNWDEETGEESVSPQRVVEGGSFCEDTVLTARWVGAEEVILPEGNAEEVACIQGISVYPARDLAQVVHHLRGTARIPVQVQRTYGDFVSGAKPLMDLSQVHGQAAAKRALEVAAAGGHNMLMIGVPGSGKTMLARCLPGILPPLTFAEALETTRIYSIAGKLRPGDGLMVTRPFSAPHHSASVASLIGGGSNARPGEVSLAHNGVLFLDELPEFSRTALEALRQPLEDGFVSVTRVRTQAQYQSSFMLVASMNPCPCGYYGSKTRKCRCNQNEIRRYLDRVSGPLLDRIDIQIEVDAVPVREINQNKPAESSAEVAVRVRKAREIQQKRYLGEGIHCNAQLDSRLMKKYCVLSPDATSLLHMAVDRMGMSMRAYGRVLKVARTVADLRGDEKIQTQDVAEAIQFRELDQKYWG